MPQDESYDRTREKRVYQYLLSFTDLGLEPDDTISDLIAYINLLSDSVLASENVKKEIKKRLPNESLIALQWGSDKNRAYIRRVLRCVYGEKLYREDEKGKDNSWSWPGLSMVKLVSILSSLEKYQKHKARDKNDPDKQSPKVTHTVKIEALRMFSELSSEERTALNISTPAGEGLVRKLYEDVVNPSYKFSYEELTGIYRQLLISKTTHRRNNSTENQHNLKEIIADYFHVLTDKDIKEPSSEKQINKVLREINRIELQSGAEQLKSFLPSAYDKDRQIAFVCNKEFARNLTKCIIENEEIKNEFPIRIKFFEIEKVRPLPLFLHKKPEDNGLINPNLIDESWDISGLERQYSYKLKIHFFVRTDQEEGKIEFFEEVTGVGSPISHATIAIDRVLMWDIPCLKEYFPVARQYFSNNEVMGESQNSPIWSHCVVQLYKKSDIENEANQRKTLEEINPNAVSHHGEYCGFDILETSAKAALIARLRAIKHILNESNTTPGEYIKELKNRVEQYNSLSTAKDFLQYYPFSLGVMKAKINSEIFKYCERYRYRTITEKNKFNDVDEEGTIVEINGKEAWSSVAYDAHLKIIEALLKEGRTVAAKKYLDALDNHLGHLSNLMYARYCVCYSQYHFLSSLENSGSRQNAILESDKHLKNAEMLLTKRLQECQLLGRLSQSNTHPFFEIHSKISMVRARMYLYFSSYDKSMAYTKPRHNSQWSRAIAPLIEAEKARIYSARDGNPSLYFSQSCFEAWVYLILAFTWDFEENPKTGFSKPECIDWAKRLLEHAIVCYEKIGLKCYADIKRNAGMETNKRHGSNVEIKNIPFIQENNDIDKPNKGVRVDENLIVLNLYLELFKTQKGNLNNEDPSRPTFFGTDSSNIMFIEGMIELCDSEHISIDRVHSAMRKFIVAWSTSRDGAFFEDNDKSNADKELYKITRIFEEDELSKLSEEYYYKEENSELLEKIDENGDRYIRGFYPHRVSKTAIFSKLLIGVCLLIIKCKQQEQSKNDNVAWSEIHKLIKGLHEKDIPEKTSDNQVQFNEHLTEHISNIGEYFKKAEKNMSEYHERFETSKDPESELANIRNKILKDIFSLIRGEKISS
jgi:hypothetical protein